MILFEIKREALLWPVCLDETSRGCGWLGLSWVSGPNGGYSSQQSAKAAVARLPTIMWCDRERESIVLLVIQIHRLLVG